MLQTSHTQFAPSMEHPSDVFAATVKMMALGHQCALVFVTDILGGAVRARGAVMVVCETGESAGYLSGGCIDADVKRQAQTAIKESKFHKLRYGEGSPFYDLKLPCGGAIEVAVCPNLAPAVIFAVSQKLNNRSPVTVKVENSGHVLIDDSETSSPDTPPKWNNNSFNVQYQPKLKLRIAGRGADPLALMNIAHAANTPTILWSPDTETIDAANSIGAQEITHLKTTNSLPTHTDDPWTAFVLMFHDAEWEAPLLKAALEGNAFYIGAVGSKNTHDRRKKALIDHGCSSEDISKIHAPIGLIPSLRDASMLAISTFAEIIDAFQKRNSN